MLWHTMASFTQLDDVQIVEADTGALPNMMLWLKAVDPSGAGAIIDVNIEASMPAVI